METMKNSTKNLTMNWKKMKRKTFEDYADLIEDIDEMNFDMSQSEFMGMISVIAKYAEAREVLEYLILEGYEISNIDIEDPIMDGYEDEFVISVMGNDVYCEKFKRKNGYFNDDSDVAYVFDNCNSKLLSHLNGDVIFEISVDEDDYEWDDLDEDDDNPYCLAMADECEDCAIYDCPVNPKYEKRQVEKKEKKAKKAEKKSKKDDKPVSKKFKSDESDVRYDRDEDDKIHGVSVRKNWDGDSYFSYSYYSSEPIDEDEAKKLVKRYGV